VSTNRVRINHQIRASELRVITDSGENLGVITLGEALRRAEEAGLDLIEISPNAVPPVAKITDYGKFQYAENKKLKESKTRVKTVEVKSVQVTISTNEHDLAVKAAKASEWLAEGHRVKVNLYLAGRAKFLDKKFLEERIERILKLIAEEYKIAEPFSKAPKGYTLTLEKGKK
jgi:translation initiation factor IF-3